LVGLVVVLLPLPLPLDLPLDFPLDLPLPLPDDPLDLFGFEPVELCEEGCCVAPGPLVRGGDWGVEVVVLGVEVVVGVEVVLGVEGVVGVAVVVVGSHELINSVEPGGSGAPAGRVRVTVTPVSNLTVTWHVAAEAVDRAPVPITASVVLAVAIATLTVRLLNTVA